MAQTGKPLISGGGEQNSGRSGWLIGIILALGLVLIVLLGPRLVALYWLSWGTDFFHRILYEDLGLSDAWSSLFAVIISFGYALALGYLLGWSLWRVLSWRAAPRQIAITFFSYLVVFALPHVIHGVANTWTNPGVCFNQRTGEPIKWYVALNGGQLVLYDSAGFDRFGIKKLPVTQEICEIFDQQQSGGFPKRTTADVHAVQFFSPTTGAPLVWYSRGADGSITLFDAHGFDPTTSVLLLPVTRDVVTEIKVAADNEVAKAKALAEHQAAEAASKPTAPQRITEDVREVVFFDPGTGAPKVWYSKTADGSIDLFDAAGFDPASGQPLKPVTREIAAAAKASTASRAVSAPVAEALVIQPPDPLFTADFLKRLADATRANSCRQGCKLDGDIEIFRLPIVNAIEDRFAYLVTYLDPFFCGSAGCSSAVVLLRKGQAYLLASRNGITDREALLIAQDAAARPFSTEPTANDSGFVQAGDAPPSKSGQHGLSAPTGHDERQSSGPTDDVVIKELSAVFADNPECQFHNYGTKKVIARSLEGQEGTFLVTVYMRYVGQGPSGSGENRDCGHAGSNFFLGQEATVTMQVVLRRFDTGWRLDRWQSGWMAGDNTWHPAI